MFARSPSLSGPGALLVLSLASLAGAETTAPEPAVLWYRSGEGCPESAAFLASVGDRAAFVRLAEAGDHVDFVVNLAVAKEGARGRLELETERGTVAIREVEDESCERVAQVLALNLSLALDPARAEPLETPTAIESVEEGSEVESESPVAAPETADDEPERVDPVDSRPDAKRKARFRVGIQGGVLSGVATRLMGRAAVFVEARPPISWAPDLTVRLAGIGALGSSETSLGAIEQALWAGRLEICPVSIGHETASVSPCASGELGQLSASGPLTDSDIWSALGAHARGIWTVASPLALEADIGANFPLNSYEIVAGSTVLYRSAVVGISASLGASIAF